MQLYKGKNCVDRQTDRHIEDEEEEEKNTKKKSRIYIGIQAAALDIRLK